MTCHHRNEIINRGPDGRIDGALPRVNVGMKMRCRCVVKGEPADHCHQVADGEDMICDPCRKICYQEAPLRFEIDVFEEMTNSCRSGCPGMLSVLDDEGMVDAHD